MVIKELAYYVDTSIIWYFLTIAASYIALLMVSIPEILSRYNETLYGNVEGMVNSQIMPPVTVIIPVFNESIFIADTVQSVLKSQYPNVQVCVVNDGSTDKTMERLIETFNLTSITPPITEKLKTLGAVTDYYVSRNIPNLMIIDKQHSGKADSLNVGINACNTPLFLTTDGDTLLEPATITMLVFSILSQAYTIVVGGAVYILNGCKFDHGVIHKKRMSFAPILAIQTGEYLRGFSFGRSGWRSVGGPLSLSGALTLFKLKPVLEAGGYQINSIGEDMEIVVRLHQKMRAKGTPYKIVYNMAAAAWTNVPRTIPQLWKQRKRWRQGFIDSLMRHKRLFLNPGYGAVGLISYPFNVVAEALGPVVEMLGYLAVVVNLIFGILSWRYAVLFFIASWGLATIITMGTALISFISFNKYKRLSDLVWFLILCTIESFGFRQFLVVCRFTATIQYLLRK